MLWLVKSGTNDAFLKRSRVYFERYYATMAMLMTVKVRSPHRILPTLGDEDGQRLDSIGLACPRFRLLFEEIFLEPFHS